MPFLYRPDPNRKQLKEDNATVEDLAVSLAKMGERSQQFENNGDFRYTNAILGQIADHRKLLDSYEVNVRRERARTDPSRMREKHPKIKSSKR